MSKEESKEHQKAVHGNEKFPVFCVVILFLRFLTTVITEITFGYAFPPRGAVRRAKSTFEAQTHISLQITEMGKKKKTL